MTNGGLLTMNQQGYLNNYGNVSLSGSYENPLYWGKVEKKQILKIDVSTLIFYSTGVFN